MKVIVRSTLWGLLSVGFCCPVARAQAVVKGVAYTVEAGTFLATDASNPFWVRSNQYGEIPLGAQGFTIRGQAKKEYSTLARKKFSYGYGLRAVMNVGTTNQFLVSEAYAKVRYGAFELYAGRRRETQGLVDSVLSAGSYIWSGNALPMPKLQISIPAYTPILKNGLLAIKGNFAHGWFGTGDSVKNYFLHQKSLYVRIGKPNWRFKIHGGFNHQVQWGGAVLYPRYEGSQRITNFGSDLQTYGYVVLGRSLYADDSLVVQNGQASAEGGNRVGNHLGTVDLGLEYEDDQNKWFLYRQSIYEAGALFRLNNIADGLTGLSFSRKQASQGVLRVVLEYLHTSSQGGPYLSNRSTIEQLRGAEDYFNNGRYIDGWVYRGQTIGTPFIMPLRYTTGLSQNLDKNTNLIVNNRVNAVTLSVMSRIRLVDLLTRISVSENFGKYSTPLPSGVGQTSVQQQVSVPFKKYTFITTLAYDNAGVLKQNLGLSFLVRQTF
ncbi:capsule assembly Wzi family protein [Spirosoma fluviale]|uniref:Capsule assembly protein Wzi n=1 Tax=Spirosoma fluviale TaxID=1597977 RepID=A0A286FDL7_9BACT|nr:capsule assembly Wzi family protein [Spirosoma fluviale]SOD81300.1 Capsule assembly protein Wzi [Spirosoma fluviale]